MRPKCKAAFYIGLYIAYSSLQIYVR